MTKEYKKLKEELVLDALSSLELNKSYQINLHWMTLLTFSSSDSVTINLLNDMQKENLLKFEKIKGRWFITPMVKFSKEREIILKEILNIKKKEGFSNTFVHILDELNDISYENYFKLLCLRYQWGYDDRSKKYIKIYEDVKDLEEVVSKFKLEEAGKTYYDNNLHLYKDSKKLFLASTKVRELDTLLDYPNILFKTSNNIMNFEQIKEKFEKLGCEVIKFPAKEISEDFEKQFGEEILEEMFGFGYKMSNKNIIQINISKLNKTSCSSTLHSEVFKDFFNLEEDHGNIITHWNILNTQYHTIEVDNDKELGSLFFLSKKCNINWYGYIYIVE